MASVDVVIVTRNTREMTARCVRSALAEDGRNRVRCFVVDNASADGTADELARIDGVTVIRNDHNAAYGRACNQGAARGNGEFVLILNSDIVVRPGSIARLVEFLEGSPEHVAAGGRVVDPGTDRVQVGHAVRAFPRASSQVAQMLGLERTWPANPLSRRALGLDLDYERTQDVDQPPGSCLAVRRADFDAIGGFDEGFYYWYEDVDLCRRLWDRGRIAYVHDAPFEHVGGATFASWDSPQRVRSWYTGVFRYFAKHRPRREQLLIRALAGLLATLRALAWAPRDRERAAALWDVARSAARPVPVPGGADPAA
ncbi:MAG TPA: glycosyltransferase family 2 protein [Solirubrobacterales bacterium]|jgi:GT2 family glycosyltransferase